jgi:hypothetical protein
VLESALEGEITDHLGYEKHDPAGAGSGNSRNGVRSKTVLTEVGPVEIETAELDKADEALLADLAYDHQRRIHGVDHPTVDQPHAFPPCGALRLRRDGLAGGMAEAADEDAEPSK